MKPRYYKALAQDLEQRIQSNGSYRLPTLLELCQQPGASYCTVWRACQLLIEKGVLVSESGKKLAIAAQLKNESSTALRSCIYRI